MSASDSSSICLNDEGSLSVLFDLKIYSATAIKKAGYKFAADCSVLLKEQAPNQIKAILNFPENIESSVKQAVARAFCNEVMDQDLREKIAIETEPTRNLILAQAFSNTSLLYQE